MLHQVSYQELKSLVLQYPYAANLRYLLLIKSYLDNNQEQEKNLALASLNSTDRKKLMELVARFQPIEVPEESFNLEEDFLELKDLNALEDMPVIETEAPLSEMSLEPPATLDDLKAEAGSGQSDAPVPDDLDDDFSFLDALLEDNLSGSDVEGESVVDEEENDLEDTLEAVASEVDADEMPTASGENISLELDELDKAEPEEDEVIEEEFSIEEIFNVAPVAQGMVDAERGADKEEPTVSVPENMEDLPPADIGESSPDVLDLEDLEAIPPPSPASWLNRVKKPQKGIMLDNLSELPPVSKKSKKKKKEKQKDAVKKVATKSILTDSDIATETLAGLLERQGYYDRAIEMYERLKEKFPERESYFGDKIEALKKMKN